MMRSMFMLMFFLLWIWGVLQPFLSGEYVRSVVQLLLGTLLYFVVFSVLWKKRKKPKQSYSSESNASWNLFISDSANTSSDSSGGDGGSCSID